MTSFDCATAKDSSDCVHRCRYARPLSVMQSLVMEAQKCPHVKWYRYFSGPCEQLCLAALSNGTNDTRETESGSQTQVTK